MVNFIVGTADLNISAQVRENLIKQLKSSSEKQKIIYIVPDQFEYETEKAIYKALGEDLSQALLKRFYEINITTFSRLCREILEANGEHRPFADDIVKNIIMHKTLSENRSSLSALNKIASHRGFCEKMVKTVSTLKTSGITAKSLELSINAISEIDKSLASDKPIMKKLSETNTLYTNYESLLSSYIDKLDVTALAAGIITKKDCKAFNGASVFVDCFNDFTASQLQFLKNVMKKADSVTFGFTSNRNSDRDVFKTPNNLIGILRDEAEKDHTVEFFEYNLAERLDENSPLRGLSKYLFQTPNSGAALGDNCQLIKARDIYEELDYAAAKIKELTLDNGYYYNEIAVLCPDINAYGKYVESVFKKYDIPIFLDTPEPILYQPLINLVSSILNALDDFSVETVLSCVKTNFFGKPKSGENLDAPQKFTALADREIDIFETYVYEWDLKTSHLKKPFTFADKNTEDAETVRRAVAEPILKLQKSLTKQGKAINGAEITEKLYNFLINEVGIKRTIDYRCYKDDGSGPDEDKVALYQRLWDALIDIFNKLHEQLGDTNVTISEYADIFREICTVTTLANPPQVVDSVLVGDIDRTRADNIKAAFIVGASYEAFPTPASEAGIFSQYEIELIRGKIDKLKEENCSDESADTDVLSLIGDIDRGFYCLKTAEEQYDLSLYRAYRAVTLPTEYLCISCPERSAGGEELTASDVFAEITSTFKDVSIINAADFGNKFYCRTLKAAKMRYAMGLNEGPYENDVLREVLNNEDREFVNVLDEIRGAREDKAYANGSEDFSGKHTLSDKTARLIFSKSIGTTSIEKLNECKFKYFCEKGLNIDERQRRSFTRNRRGVAIHYIFQHVLNEYSGDMNAFFTLKRNELLSLSKKYLDKYRAEETNNDNAEDKRTEYLFNNIASSATDVLITIQTELFFRHYRPKFFELNINTAPDSEQSRHAIIDNEQSGSISLPEPEIFCENGAAPIAPKSAALDETDENAPFLITAPLEIKLGSGDTVTVHGIIDRVDMFKANNDNDNSKAAYYVRVIDYKSAVHSFDLNNAKNGMNIQMLLYLFALQSANKDNKSIELRPGGVSYIPSNNNGAFDKELPPYRLLAMNYHESGLLVKDDVTEDDYNKYKDSVFQKVDADSTLEEKDRQKIKNSFEPNENNLANADKFDELRREVIGKITENLDAIFSGTIDALPTSYYQSVINTDGSASQKLTDPCKYCRFSDICQNAGKNVNKIEKESESNDEQG